MGSVTTHALCCLASVVLVLSGCARGPLDTGHDATVGVELVAVTGGSAVVAEQMEIVVTNSSNQVVGHETFHFTAGAGSIAKLQVGHVKVEAFARDGAGRSLYEGVKELDLQSGHNQVTMELLPVLATYQIDQLKVQVNKPLAWIAEGSTATDVTIKPDVARQFPRWEIKGVLHNGMDLKAWLATVKSNLPPYDPVEERVIDLNGTTFQHLAVVQKTPQLRHEILIAIHGEYRILFDFIVDDAVWMANGEGVRNVYEVMKKSIQMLP